MIFGLLNQSHQVICLHKIPTHKLVRLHIRSYEWTVGPNNTDCPHGRTTPTVPHEFPTGRIVNPDGLTIRTNQLPHERPNLDELTTARTDHPHELTVRTDCQSARTVTRMSVTRTDFHPDGPVAIRTKCHPHGMPIRTDWLPLARFD